MLLSEIRCYARLPLPGSGSRSHLPEVRSDQHGLPTLDVAVNILFLLQFLYCPADENDFVPICQEGSSNSQTNACARIMHQTQQRCNLWFALCSPLPLRPYGSACL